MHNVLESMRFISLADSAWCVKLPDIPWALPKDERVTGLGPEFK